jgi:pyruvate/2-oxoglutarate dehydrogenase complex dihydrolipoamide acyltransferase (E2) component
MVTENVLFTNSERCCKLVQWKVKPGDQISKGRILLHFSSDSDKPSDEVVKLKAIKVGTIVKVFLKEGDVIKPG